MMTSVIRVRAPADLVDKIESGARDLNLDRSSFVRMLLTEKLRPAREADVSRAPERADR